MLEEAVAAGDKALVFTQFREMGDKLALHFSANLGCEVVFLHGGTPKRATGRYERTTVGGEEVAAFIPHALPPADPLIVVDAALAGRLRAAEQALVRLELAGEMVPSLDWFIATRRAS